MNYLAAFILRLAAEAAWSGDWDHEPAPYLLQGGYFALTEAAYALESEAS